MSDLELSYFIPIFNINQNKYMDLNKFGKRAYRCALKRGKVTDTVDIPTYNKEMCNGIGNEMAELAKASELLHGDHLPQYTEVVEELTDVAIAAMTELYRRGVDIEKVLHEKMKYNETRKD